MGNKLGRRRQVVDEKYTRPQGLYQIKDVDYKKLKKLILESKLAPCYPGGDESDSVFLDECPICFLYYPTLNRSRCCTKSICTECFLQMKNPNSSRPTQCPFCKTSNYAVEYRGVKSKEERGMEQIEEQKVIEAKIRMRQQELQEEEERQQRKEQIHSSSIAQIQNPACSTSGAIECEEIAHSQDMDATQMISQPQNIRQNRDGEFDLDLEDIMVMEAVWLSIQENGQSGTSSAGNVVPEQFAARDHYLSRMGATVASPSSSSSPSGGLACAIAALAERQQLNGESSRNYSGDVSHLDMLPTGGNSTRAHNKQPNPPDSFFSSNIPKGNSKRVKNNQRKYSHEGASSNGTYDERMYVEEWELDHGSVIAEAGTSYASSGESDESLEGITLLPPPPPPPPPYDEASNSSGGSDDDSDISQYLALPPPPPPPLPPPPPTYDTDGGYQSAVPGTIVPESFEEQMMLAMAVSLAEARARTTVQGVAWQ